MAALFHCSQADGYSEAVASLRWAQDIRRVPKAAITEPLDDVCYPGMDRDRRCRASKVCRPRTHPTTHTLNARRLRSLSIPE